MGDPPLILLTPRRGVSKNINKRKSPQKTSDSEKCGSKRVFPSFLPVLYIFVPSGACPHLGEAPSNLRNRKSRCRRQTKSEFGEAKLTYLQTTSGGGLTKSKRHNPPNHGCEEAAALPQPGW